MCNSPAIWNSEICECVCPYLAICIQGYVWDSTTCRCRFNPSFTTGNVN
jgi:hypothetical protein